MLLTKARERENKSNMTEQKYSLDADIGKNQGLFTSEEYARLSAYRNAINAVVVDGTMSKPMGKVLGENLEDYISLTMKLPLVNGQ